MRPDRTFKTLTITIAIICCLCGIPTFTQAQSVPTSVTEFCEQPKEVLNELIDEAEREVFAVRRLEFTGNTYTRDREFRKRMVLVNEGYIFERKNLEKALKGLSKMKTIYPVTLSDIRVFLNRASKDIDFLVCIKQRPKK